MNSKKYQAMFILLCLSSGTVHYTELRDGSIHLLIEYHTQFQSLQIKRYTRNKHGGEPESEYHILMKSLR